MSTHSFKPDDLAMVLLPKTDPHYQAALGRPIRLINKLDQMHKGYTAGYERWFFEFVDGKSINGKFQPYMSVPTKYLEPHNQYPAPAKPVPKGLPDL